MTDATHRRLPWVILCLILTAQALAIFGAERTYKVQRNDTLGEIARRNGVTVTRLMQRNGLVRPDRIYAGQVLRIPASQTAAKAPALNPALSKELEGIKPAPGRWKHIVIHHSGVASGTVAGMDRYHREERHMENGLAYHFVIGNGKGLGNGKIEIGHRWSDQIDGGHLASDELNKESIGICLVGNFDSKRPTAEQMKSLKLLVGYLMERCKLQAGAVQTHQQINPIHTRCPGKYFPAKTFLKEVAASAK
jgi:murein DD-endopeptidase MepM/ murein hydrolase activator NlpD